MSKAITQRIAAERHAESKGLTPDQPAYWSLVAGILTGHLCQRDEEQDAGRAPRVAEGEARVVVEHMGVSYLIDYEYDEDARCAEVTHIWCGPDDLMPMFGDELAAVPSFAERAADADLKRHAGAIRRAGRALECAMASGTDLLVPAPVWRAAA